MNANAVLLFLSALSANATCMPKDKMDLPHLALCGPHNEIGCARLREWCEWVRTESYGHVPMSVGACVSKPGLEAWGAYCTGTTETDCMAGAGSAYCDWTGSGSQIPAPPAPAPPAPSPPTPAPPVAAPPTQAPKPPTDETPVVGVPGGLVGPYNLTPCTVDVSQGEVQGLDISDVYVNYPNPFEFYTSANDPGVTLPGPDRASKCHWTTGTPAAGEVPFTWNSMAEQCILNGVYTSIYPYEKDTCVTGEKNVMPYEDRKIWSESVGKSVMLTVPGESSPVEVVIGVGHGPLNGACGAVSLVQNTSKTYSGDTVTTYAAVARIGTRAWSYEISEAAAIHLAVDNRGGTCYIPNVAMMTDADVQTILRLL